MENSIINKSRYKKTTSINKRKRDLKKNIKKQSVQKVEIKEPTIKVKKITNKNSKQKINKNRYKNNKVLNIILCIILILIIAILSRAILKKDSEPFFGNILTSSESINKINKVTVGVVDDNSITNGDTKNILIKELDNYVYRNMLNADSEYNITYDVVKSIVKITNTDYVINLDEKIDVQKLVETLNEYRNKTSPYYYKFSNVKEIKHDGNVLNITLKQADPTFIYNLNVPIESMKKPNVIKTLKDKAVDYTKKIDEENSISVNVTSIDTIENTVSKYKEGTLDSFITSRAEIKTMLGKYEYNIKNIVTGKGIYLIGNKDSKLFSKKEIRQAICYSIDRDNIIKEVKSSKAKKIDLPYVFDEPKYKYDIYATDNVLLTNGYSKYNGIYRKIDNSGITQVKLTLVVNSEDEEKLKVAKYIKEDLESSGIGIVIKQYKETKLKQVIKNKDYDIALITINVNDVPSVSFINEYLNINEAINTKIKELENSNTNDIKEHIDALRNTLSSEVACIGIYSDVSYFISKKNIEDFSNITYMNIFKEIF